MATSPDLTRSRYSARAARISAARFSAAARCSGVKLFPKAAFFSVMVVSFQSCGIAVAYRLEPFDYGIAGMDRGEIDAQGPAVSRLRVPAVVHGEDSEAIEYLRERAAHLREVRRGAAFRARVSRDSRPMAQLARELFAVFGDRQPPVPRGVALPSEQLHRPHAKHMGAASGGKVDDRLHRCSRLPEVFQIRQEVYPATA